MLESVFSLSHDELFVQGTRVCSPKSLDITDQVILVLRLTLLCIEQYGLEQPPEVQLPCLSS
jgi:hypothetical protein